MDGDGDLDAIVDDIGALSRMFLNKDGLGDFDSAGHTVGGGHQFTALGNLDGDGDLDAYTAVDLAPFSNQVWLNGE